MSFLKTRLMCEHKEFASFFLSLSSKISVLNVHVSSTDLASEGAQMWFSHSTQGARHQGPTHAEHRQRWVPLWAWPREARLMGAGVSGSLQSDGVYLLKHKTGTERRIISPERKHWIFPRSETMWDFEKSLRIQIRIRSFSNIIGPINNLHLLLVSSL